MYMYISTIDLLELDGIYVFMGRVFIHACFSARGWSRSLQRRVVLEWILGLRPTSACAPVAAGGGGDGKRSASKGKESGFE